MNSSAVEINSNQPAGTIIFIQDTTAVQVTKLIELLTSIIAISYIFSCKPAENSTIRLIIVLDRYRYQEYKGAGKILEFLLYEQWNIEFICFSYGTMNDILLKGHPFYSIQCCMDNCLYQNLETDQLPPAIELVLQKIKSAANIILDKRIDKAKEFLNGASTYFNQGCLQMAAFMLNQSYEQILMLIIKLYSNKELKSHDLMLLRKTAGFYYPEIKNIFDLKDRKELKWLRMLQAAYVGVRYPDDYQVEVKDLVFLKEKLDYSIDYLFHKLRIQLDHLEEIND